jgi:polar amino acid transport system permease protein
MNLPPSGLALTNKRIEPKPAGCVRILPVLYMQVMEEQTKGAPSRAEHEMAHIPGAEPSTKLDAWWGVLAAVILIILLLVFSRPDPFQRIVLFVSDGIGVTIFTTVVSFVLVLVVGMLGGLGRLSHNRIVFGVTTLYVEVIRGIPLLVQLLFWYYALPPIIQNIGRATNLGALTNFQADPIMMAVVGLTICYGAYMSEVYRAGIQSIPKGQLEAARSQGMTYLQAMRYVILPQAVRVILPPVGNEFISLLKDTSLVSVVAVADMTRRGREFMSTNFNPIETWLMIGLLYLVLTLLSARVVAWLEKRTKIDRR